MKEGLWILFCLIVGIIAGSASGAGNRTPDIPLPRPRFELIHAEENHGYFRVFRDRETGQEIVCRSTHEGYSPATSACWLTGRNWPAPRKEGD